MREKQGGKVVEVSPDRLTDAGTMEQRHVIEVYDAISPHFSATRYKPWPKVRMFIESLPKYSVVADVGCGNGRYFGCTRCFRVSSGNDEEVSASNEGGSILPAYRHVVGIDLSEGLLRQIGRLRTNKQLKWDNEGPVDTVDSSLNQGGVLDHIDLLRADACHTALRGNIFDAAISIAVIHHLATHERRVEAVCELLRLLRPGGLALISVWAKEQPTKRTRTDAADVFVRWEMHELHDSKRRVYQRYYHLFSSGELECLVEEAGAVVKESYFDKENWCVILQKGEKLSQDMAC
ncbi:Methyltransferase domain [Trypanosoma vivax]|uniref:Methyltransferase type 11 domain-containing protein n=1 Tax=Trypanosoma vivax (strain Y486) TaxID=1055687 RepID=G0U732_TRYVY|nr:hypothetical protein TRVL_01281 [Trypanosoma vivax]KAH8611634.1 Methyltransferase domain [Trypanosoma vivax]CCC51689.1 conserved hypothetical protein [Trypanosoma vivax Y486]